MKRSKATALFKFIKDNPTLFEGGHSVFTPEWLTKEIVSQIDVTDKTILVMFNVEFVATLVYTTKIDPQSVTLYCDHPYKLKIAKILGVKYITNLTKAIDEKMKFDVVIGNPPYQNGKDQYFYKEFVEQAFALVHAAGTVAFVTSANWVSGTGKAKKFFKKIVSRMTHYRYLGGKAFNAQILTAYFICRPDVSGEIQVITDSAITKVSKENFASVSSGQTEALSIITRIKNTAINNFLTFESGKLARNKAIKVANGTKCIFGGGKTNQDFDWFYVNNASDVRGLKQHKVVFSKNSSIGNIGPTKYADPTFGCAANAYYIACNTKDEANHIISYLNSKLVKCIVKTLKHASCTNSKGLINQLPKVPFNKVWTDKALYDHFGLSEEEREYVETNVK